jgi:hypothetical protein
MNLLVCQYSVSFVFKCLSPISLPRTTLRQAQPLAMLQPSAIESGDLDLGSSDSGDVNLEVLSQEVLEQHPPRPRVLPLSLRLVY